MPTRHLLRYLFVCLFFALGCGGESPGDPDGGPDAGFQGVEVPLGASLPPLAYTLELTYGDEPFIPPRPDTVVGHLYLDVAGDGSVSGAISAREIGTVGLAPIGGMVVGREIVLAGAQVEVAPGGQLGLDELRLALRDDDGDGAVDGASGEAAGEFSRALSDVVGEATHTSVLTAGPDRAATAAGLFVPRNVLTLLPYEAVELQFGEALREGDVRDRVRILADGEPVAGELEVEAIGGFIARALFRPGDFLPFGADVTLDVTGLADPSGNELATPDGRIPVVADPGALGKNAGFESGLDGWISLGAAVEGAFQGFPPEEGSAQAVVREGSTLAAVLDVGAEASELELSVAVLVEGSEVDADRTAVIALRGPAGEQIEIFDVADVIDQLQACTTCTEYGASVGPLRRTADITALRGRRVFLTIDVRSSFFFGVNFFAALVDDVQVR